MAALRQIELTRIGATDANVFAGKACA